MFAFWENLAYGADFENFKNMPLAIYSSFNQQLGDLGEFTDFMQGRAGNALTAWFAAALFGAITLTNIFINLVGKPSSRSRSHSHSLVIRYHDKYP